MEPTWSVTGVDPLSHEPSHSNEWIRVTKMEACSLFICPGDNIDNYPTALWFTIVTMTTVGAAHLDLFCLPIKPTRARPGAVVCVQQ
eukprot:2933428-Amphidinium_carterae.1